MKGKFKFSNVNKEEKPKETKESSQVESEVFNITELKKYYVEFTEKAKKIEENFNILEFNINEENALEMNPDNIILKDNDSKLKFLDEINNTIKNLREDYKLNASFMSNYDQHNYLNILENLTKKYNDFKEKISPKKKFVFSNKAATKAQNEEYISKNQNINLLDCTKNTDEIVISQKANENIIFHREDIKDRNSLFLENLNNCEIFILFNFKALYAKEIKNCKIYIGSVSGGSHITDCDHSSFYMITHQLRIHKTHNTNFSIIISSNPIIEDCSGLLFSCLKIKYRDLEENLKVTGIDLNKNKWNAVLDFKWHKREKSPNFDYDENNSEILLEY